MLVPAVMVLEEAIKVVSVVAAIEVTSEQVIASLNESASTYQPGSDIYGNLVQSLKPTESISPNSKRMAYHLKFILAIYLVQHLIIAAVYLPTLVLIYQRLKKKNVPKDHLAMVATEVSSAQHAQESSKVRNRLIQHGILILIEEILYIPPIVYMLFFFKGPRFYNDPNFLLVDQVVLHGPSVIVGNVIMTFSIQNTLYTIRKSKREAFGQTEITFNPGTNPEKTNKNDLVASVA
ncbi:hypothetical protein PCANC_10522 [Puccinia coronata f. sp. avenae]|uniref:Uncharacterized protein n=1 Tax=Puccinia coronata f. sp. avenae TaxID=200324 RepID=A0A2N5VZ51_9BASI|nr:hypothetical protein PCANC_17510 [Puccinia coronata f. sp. avenae]PLW55260.1 hypothetical protein PCANC_10522 [Puccinia coronata f. sp. avenae]